MAWPPLVSGSSAIVADQTGSGKTLAYLLPGLYRILLAAPENPARNETDGAENNKKKRHGAPRMVVLTPTSELADQVKAVCDKINRNLESSSNEINRRYKVSSAVLTATGQYSTDIREQIRLLQRQRVDVLVSTPGRLATILRTRNHNVDLSGVQTLVLDEVDVLLQDDDSFGPQLRTISAGLGDMEKTQFVFCTATLPDSIVSTIEREFPVGLQQIRGPGLHRVALNLKERLVDVSVPSASNRNPDACFDLKADCLLDALRKNKCRRTLVFCNTVDSCRDVENLLSRHDRSSKLYSVLPFHNALTPETRNRNLQTFVRGPRRDATTEKRSGRVEPSADSVLVCTDRAARGVDFAAAPVDHVVIFDFPKDPAEYVRRVGRTARAGRPGTCTVFAYGWQLPIARSVMGAKLPGTAGFSVSSVVDDDDDDMGPNDKLRYGKKIGQRRTGGKDEESVKSIIEKGKLWGD
jgi:ATP-dependent RNA helicase DDX18/HAS1